MCEADRSFLLTHYKIPKKRKLSNEDNDDCLTDNNTKEPQTQCDRINPSQSAQSSVRSSSTALNSPFLDRYKIPNYPAELNAMFQPLFCKLCSLSLSSSIVASLHYQGKNHVKKVKAYLIDYCIRTGEKLPEGLNSTTNKPDHQNSNFNPSHFHCNICDLSLTGELHAKSHYMGKSHRAALSGRKAPAGKGFFDSEGKWHRLSASKSNTPLKHDDAFGLAFRETIPSKNDTSRLRCELCNVAVTSQAQLEVHMRGQKHVKKCKYADGEEHSLMAACRTPTGDFYCQQCDLSVNSEIQFSQHLASKKHKKKSSVAKI